MFKHVAHGVLALMLGLTAGACADDESASASEASAGTCTPGQAGCPCAQGNACVVGLLCVSNACIDPGGVSGGDTTGGTTSGDATGGGSTSTTSGGSTTTGTPGSCVNNDACAEDALCFDGTCTPIADLFFDVTVHAFEPPDCLDGWGSAELYYDYYQGGALISSSAISGCPGEWSDETIFYDSLQSFALEFWDSDAFNDDYITTLCWGGDVCEGIPFTLLRQGGWAGLDGSATYYLDLTFEPVSR